MSDRPSVSGTTSGRLWRPAARLAAPLGVLGAALAGLGYVGAVDPGQPGHYPACPFLRSTGFLCPGCGGLRSAHALVHGDLAGALEAHALAVVGSGVAAVVWGVWCVRALRGKPPGRRVEVIASRPAHRRARSGRGPVLWALVCSLFAVFTVVRNLPWGSALRPEGTAL